MKRSFQALFAAALIGAVASRAAAEPIVYIPLGGAGEILVVDAGSDKVLRTIAGTPDVHGLAGSAAGRVLVAGRYSDAEPGEVAVPPKPAGMSEAEHRAHHPARAKPAAKGRKGVSFVSIIRGDGRSVARRIEVPGAVHHTAVTRDGRYAIATHPDNGGISIIDLTRFNVVKSIPTGPNPNYAVVARDGYRAYVSNAGNDTVSEIDMNGWVVMRTFATGKSPEHMVLSPDGRRLYVNNAEAGTVSVIALDRGKATATYKIGGELHGIDVSDDGQTLFVSGKEENKLVAIDLGTGRQRSVPLAPAPYHLTVIRGTGKLYVSSRAESKIWVVDQRSLKSIGEISIRGNGHQMVVVTR